MSSLEVHPCSRATVNLSGVPRGRRSSGVVGQQAGESKPKQPPHSALTVMKPNCCFTLKAQKVQYQDLKCKQENKLKAYFNQSVAVSLKPQAVNYFPFNSTVKHTDSGYSLRENGPRSLPAALRPFSTGWGTVANPTAVFPACCATQY